MPTLRSREVVCNSNFKTPSKRKREQPRSPSSPPAAPNARESYSQQPLFTPPPSGTTSPISPAPGSSKGAFSSRTTTRSSGLGLGLASRRRRSLRLGTMADGAEGPGRSLGFANRIEMDVEEEGRGKMLKTEDAEVDQRVGGMVVEPDASVPVGESDQTRNGGLEEGIPSTLSPVGNIDIDDDGVRVSSSSVRRRSARFTATEKGKTKVAIEVVSVEVGGLDSMDSNKAASVDTEESPERMVLDDEGPHKEFNAVGVVVETNTSVSVGESDKTLNGRLEEAIPSSLSPDDGVRGGSSNGRRRSARFTAAEKGKTKVVATEVVSIEIGGLDSKDSIEAASMETEAGPERMVMNGEGPDKEFNAEEIPAAFLEEDRIARQTLERNKRVNSTAGDQNATQNDRQPENKEGTNSGEISKRRKAFRDGALKAAPKFAYYREAGAKGDVDSENSDIGEPESEDWPGPFSTAMKLINEREAKLKARLAEGSSSASEQVDLKWKPAARQGVVRVAPTLAEMAMKILCENASHIVSLEGLPSPFLKQFCLQASATGNMDCHVLSLLANSQPTELHLANCTFATEEKFEEIFSRCSFEQLEVLQLDLSGRCLPDYVLRSTFARGSNSLPILHSVSLRGNYRISDDGLTALASAAPMLRTVDLSHCSLITSSGVSIFLEKLEATITELILDDCATVSGLQILPSLKKIKNLEVVSVSGLVDVNNRFVTELVSSRGQNLKGLGIAGCGKLSTNTIKTISEKCRQLSAIDLRNISKLDDGMIMHLASCCLPIQKLKLQRGDCSDNAVAALIESSGKSLVELSLNHFEKVAHNTALAISSACSSSLQELDLSFCRMMSDEALGLIADSCSSLKTLKIFGCTQVTNVFLNGHSNRHLNVIGLTGSILK